MPGRSPATSLSSLTGDPASAEFVREAGRARGQASRAAARPGAQVVVGVRRRSVQRPARAGRRRGVRRAGADSRRAVFRGRRHDARARRRTWPCRVSRRTRCMVSDYPERLTENGMLFTADLRSEQPSRFLYFHYNPPGQPDRRIVLRAENRSRRARDRAVHQRSRRSVAQRDGSRSRCRPSDFSSTIVQNQGRLMTIGANSFAEHRRAGPSRRHRRAATCCSCACSPAATFI